MNAKHRTTLILALITSMVIFGCGLGQVAPTSIPVSTPTTTTTPLPTNTAMPTATPAPSIVGTLVEATIITPPDEKTKIGRPSLANEVVLLCLKTQNTCTIDKSLSVKTDENGSFVFDSVPAGEYVILYAAFLNQQEDTKSTEDFWTYWDGKVLDFSDLDSFAASFIDPSTAMPPQFVSDRGYGILPALSQQAGGMSNTGVCYMPKFMAVEFIGDMEPLTVTVIPGQTAQVTVEAHAGLVIVLF